jgi:1-acyl-sn-glycerol-3-phosphate acyltransferase
MNLLRSILFFILGVIVTVLHGIVLIPVAFVAQDVGYACAKSWGRSIVWLAKWVCGIDYQIRGAENMPSNISKRACVVMAKHQSAWETVGLLANMPRSSWIIKRELVYVPIVGWALASLRSIAIDRKSGKAARDQILEQGRERLADGHWVIIFPEGTRVAPGERGRYGLGGAWLAAKTGAPVLPIAHNAGELWRRNAFIKRPGLVTMSIGPVIETAGKEPLAVLKEVEEWIENEMAQLPSAVR